MIGRTLSHYRITAKLGEGGMGEVWRATDTALNRDVALKVLPDEMAADPERLERFRREAQAIAALNHPNVVTIHSVEDADGVHLLTMELVDGKSLDQILPPSGFDIERLFPLAIQIADALASAHKKGIVHRDLKPANVMVTGDGRVKVLDFGLAKLAEPEAEDAETQLMTRDGMILGTIPYMSPEQVQAKPVEHRSDIFSLGILLYEMATGGRPFRGDNEASVISAVLRDQPPSVTEVKADLPNHLGRIVQRCLEKDPERRYQSAKDVRYELEVLREEVEGLSRRLQTIEERKAALQQATHRSDGAQASIAVLPFANLGAEPENEYFGDGLAEEIMNALAQVDGLKVIARTSAFSFKGKSQDVRQIAQVLGVSHVLEGSVRRSGDRLRVSAQLVAAADGAHAWSERFDRPMTDVFAMQDEMAAAITTALRGRLGVARAPARQYVPDIDAYESYLSGRTHLGQFTPEAFNRAKADLDRAMRADPSYAKPHAELALAYFIRGMHFVQPMREVAPLVRAGATRALELDPTDPQPRFVLGAIALAEDYQWADAAEHFAASMSGPHVPGHARWIYASLYLRGLGRFEESAAEMRRAAEQDPLNATWQAIWAAHLIDANRVEEAMDIARRAIDIDSTYFLPHNMLGESSWAAGRRGEAVAAFERAHALAPWFAVTSGWLAAAYRLTGRDDRADALLETMGPTSRPFWGRVLYHLLTSELDAAADWYERLIEERDPFALLYARTSTTGPLRAHHRWLRLSELMKLPE